MMEITFGNDKIGTVQFYGKLYTQFASFGSSGATAPQTPRWATDGVAS